MFSFEELVVAFIVGICSAASLMALGGWFYQVEERWLRHAGRRERMRLARLKQRAETKRVLSAIKALADGGIEWFTESYGENGENRYKELNKGAGV